jgi:hypothetical protein
VIDVTKAPGYDRAYCSNRKHFRDPTCKHEDTVVYDAKFEGEVQTKMQVICTVCGMISEWSSNRRGMFACTFPTTK